MKFQFPKTLQPIFMKASAMQWQSWTWQLQNALKSQGDYEQFFSLTESEALAFKQSKNIFKIQTTPYYASLAQNNAVRRIVVPDLCETSHGAQELVDPLAERKPENRVAKRLVHRYPDRVLFLITDNCGVYCRYCTRKHFTGHEQAFLNPDEYRAAMKYIYDHKGIREVILSGGDPLTVSDGKLDMVLSDLRRIEHVEIIRVGTRMPVVSPFRITDELIQIFKKNKPVYLMTHFNHPRELTFEAATALEKLVDSGVPVYNQMVLLNGVNNHPAIIQALSRRLLYLRVKPYYMFQCDPSIGTDHLRTSVEQSLRIQRELWGNLSGLAMPSLALDIPDGGGKAGLVPNFEIEASPEQRVYQGFDGVKGQYKNPKGPMLVPTDVGDYIPEWESLKNAKGTPGAQENPKELNF
jgi:lysine 2,3-aminomutase